jgi:putative transcriptional regulator
MTIGLNMPRWVAALTIAAALFAAITAAADNPPPVADPAPGELLIASAAIQDPRFHHSVILVVRHDQTGAFGIVINHPLGERPLAELLADPGGRDSHDSGSDKDDKIEGTIRVFLGGPVQPQYGFVIHSGEYRRPETMVVGDKLAMTANKNVLRDIAHQQGPAKYLFALGYAGWGAGQLEGEIARHDWFTAPAEPDLVFDADRDRVWDNALARRTREL